MENLVLVSSVVLVFQFELSWDAFIMRMKSSQFVHFKYLVYLLNVSLILNHASLEICAFYCIVK